jgi:hypothetical protein
MVELPQYVRRVLKPNGQAFYYYARHRGTSDAWPSISLPDPFDKDFAERLAICNALERVDGRFLLSGIQLPSHIEKDFWSEAKKATKIALAGDSAKTFSVLIAKFKAHKTYESLAEATRRGYDHYADLVEAAWGNALVSELTTVDAQEAIDAMGDTPAAANQFRAFLSRLLAFSVPRGFATDNVASSTEKMVGSEPWPSWEDWAFDLFFTHAPHPVAFPVVSALFTGQRQVDVLRMPRPKKADPTIPVRAQKTGEIVWIPIHSEYRQWIEMEEERRRSDDEARVRAGKLPRPPVLQLHVGFRGSPYTTDGYRAEWTRLMSKKAEDGTLIFSRFRAERIVFHGVRKNAVNSLLEVGCTESQVGAIVNMSEQMVRHYSRDVRVRALARDGMKLLESRWAEVRPRGLPRTGTERELETKG